MPIGNKAVVMLKEPFVLPELGLSAHYQAAKKRGVLYILLYFLSTLNRSCLHISGPYLLMLHNDSTQWLEQMPCESPDLGMSFDFSICILLLATGIALEVIQQLDDLLLYLSIACPAVYRLKLFSSRLLV